MNFAEVAKAVDASRRPAGPAEGYVAERHGLIKNLVLVWAPCGCVWGGDTTQSFVTPCQTENCSYSHAETLEAVKALLTAEQAAPVVLQEAATDSSKPKEASDEADLLRYTDEGGLEPSPAGPASDLSPKG